MKELKGLIKVKDINVGDEFYPYGKVQNIRETKTLRIITCYPCQGTGQSKIFRFKIGQSIYV